MIKEFLIFCLLSFFLLTACSSLTPYKDYALAKSALQTAKKFSADKLAPRYYSKSLALYKKAVSSYKQKEYDRAGSLFEEAIILAEKAELQARIKRKKDEEL